MDDNVELVNRKKRFDSKLLIMLASLAVALVLPINYYIEKHGGRFLATVNDKEIISPMNRTILVYMDKDSVDLLMVEDVFPRISNPGRFPLSDVLLKYTVEADSSNIIYSDYYTVRNTNDITLDNNRLFSKQKVPIPMRLFVMKANGQASIDLEVTYWGIKDPFVYQSKIFTKRIIEKENLSREGSVFIDADVFFSKNKDFDKIDLYILYNDSIAAFQNFTKDSVYRRYSYNHGRIGGYGAAHNAALSDESKNTITESVSWPLYVIAGIFLVLFIIGFALLVSMTISNMISGYRRDDVIGLLSALIIWSIATYASLYGFIKMLFPEKWPLFAWIFGVFVLFVFAQAIFGNLFKSNNKTYLKYLVLVLTWLILSTVLYFIIL